VLKLERAASASVTTMTLPIPTRKGDGTDEAASIHKIVGGQPDLFGDLIAPHLTQLSRIVRATIGGHRRSAVHKRIRSRCRQIAGVSAGRSRWVYNSLNYRPSFHCLS
jgi:hypothetical protein